MWKGLGRGNFLMLASGNAYFGGVLSNPSDKHAIDEDFYYYF